MKLVKPILLGMITATNVLGAGVLSVSAEEGDTDKVTTTVGGSFTLDEGGTGPVNPIDPIEPGEPQDPNPGGNGPLRIDHASNFNFGEINIDSLKGVTAYANLDGWRTENGVEPIPNYVQVTDNRLNKTGWKLTVEQTEQLNVDGFELKGAQIILANIEAESVNDSKNPDNKDNIILDPDGTSDKVAWAADSTEASDILEAQGIGTNIIRFGNAGNAHESVILDIPAGISILEGEEYTTQITWTLHNTSL